MSASIQRSFAGGEVAPELHARADLARYAIGLRTCRNMVVMRAGGASKRPGSKVVKVDGQTAVIGSTDMWVVHVFTISDDFIVTHGGDAEVLIIGGAASGASVDGTGVGGGGGGAGGVIHLDAHAFTPGTYVAHVGGGAPAPIADHTLGSGTLGVVPGFDGESSSFVGRTAGYGGGGGGADVVVGRAGRPGHNEAGCGGGGASAGDSGGVGAASGSTGSDAFGSDGSSGVHDSNSVGGQGGGTSYVSDIENVPGGATKTYAREGAVRFGPGLPVAANMGHGGEGGGLTLGAQGSAGSGGRIVVRYKASTGFVATGGTIITFPIPH